MIESGFGRTDTPGLGKVGPQTRAAAKPRHGDVREPRAPLGPVRPEPLEPFRKACLQEARAAVLVVEDEHGDALRLAVAGHGEHRSADARSGLVERLAQERELARRPSSEEGERDVQVRGRHDPHAAGTAEGVRLPARERLRDVSGERKAEEEARAHSPTVAGLTRNCRRTVTERAGEMQSNAVVGPHAPGSGSSAAGLGRSGLDMDEDEADRLLRRPASGPDAGHGGGGTSPEDSTRPRAIAAASPRLRRGAPASAHAERELDRVCIRDDAAKETSSRNVVSRVDQRPCTTPQWRA
jgi:hypothetical protein